MVASSPGIRKHTKSINEATPDENKVVLEGKEGVKVNFKTFEPLLRAMVGLENGSNSNNGAYSTMTRQLDICMHLVRIRI